MLGHPLALLLKHALPPTEWCNYRQILRCTSCASPPASRAGLSLLFCGRPPQVRPRVVEAIAVQVVHREARTRWSTHHHPMEVLAPAAASADAPHVPGLLPLLTLPPSPLQHREVGSIDHRVVRVVRANEKQQRHPIGQEVRLPLRPPLARLRHQAAGEGHAAPGLVEVGPAQPVGNGAGRALWCPAHVPALRPRVISTHVPTCLGAVLSLPTSMVGGEPPDV